jgi:hypothetical protein
MNAAADVGGFFCHHHGNKVRARSRSKIHSTMDAKQATTIIINNDVHLSVTLRCITLAQDISNFVPAAVERTRLE